MSQRKILHILVDPKGIIADLPRDAKPLTVKIIRGKPYLFVEFDPAAPTIEQYFKVISTGQLLTDRDPEYVESFVIDTPNAAFAFHVYRVPDKIILAPPDGSH